MTWVLTAIRLEDNNLESPPIKYSSGADNENMNATHKLNVRKIS